MDDRGGFGRTAFEILPKHCRRMCTSAIEARSTPRTRRGMSMNNKVLYTRIGLLAALMGTLALAALVGSGCSSSSSPSNAGGGMDTGILPSNDAAIGSAASDATPPTEASADGG